MAGNLLSGTPIKCANCGESVPGKGVRLHSGELVCDDACRAGLMNGEAAERLSQLVRWCKERMQPCSS